MLMAAVCADPVPVSSGAAYHRRVTRRAVTYASYLKVPELLALQVERSEGADGPEHDELLFIVIHQVYELWFKQLRHELAGVQLALEAGDTDRALHLLNRVLKILKTLVAQVDVLETMTPLQFLSFRDRLESASGFQSAGFRLVEAMLGIRDPAAVRLQPEGSDARSALDDAQTGPSLWDAFLAYLGARGHAIPADPDVAGRAGPGRAHRDLSRRRRRRPRRGTAGRPRRGCPGVALSPREDGRTDDRH